MTISTKRVYQLQSDVDFVCLLRCFSAWIRDAGDAREARGERTLQLRLAEVKGRRSLIAMRFVFLLVIIGPRLCSQRTPRKVSKKLSFSLKVVWELMSKAVFTLPQGSESEVGVVSPTGKSFRFV